jgi:serine protease
VVRRAEAVAGSIAERRARDVLGRLGVQGEVQVRPGGVVRVQLAHRQRSLREALQRQQQLQRPQLRSGQRAVQPLAEAQSTEGPKSAEEAAPAQAVEAAEPEAVQWTGAECPRIVNAAQLEQDVALATRCTVARLQQANVFEYVEPNFIATVDFDRLPWARPRQPEPKTPAPSEPAPTEPEDSVSLPDDPLAALQWHYRARGAQTGQAPGGAGFESFWVEARQIGSRQVRIAVVDTGLDTRHPEISGNENVAAGVDLITDPSRANDADGPDRDAYDSGDRCGTQAENSYHGTHVAGTAGAVRTNDRVGVAGGIWQVTIVPVRVLGRCGGELADIASGIRWAAGVAPAVLADGTQLTNGNPADIINLSLSVAVPCPASMQSAIDAAVERGAVVVVAAGNKANRTRNYAPANCNNVVVVGAGDYLGNLTFYSNFGEEVDILAPGGDTFADRDGDGRPDGILSSRTAAAGCYDPAASNGATSGQCFYSYLQGTSMAAPHVSAALALLASQTGLRGRELENALFTRAMSPIDAAQCRIDCSRNANATPVPGSPGQCMRACGRGMLDMARAATNAPVQPAGAPASQSGRRR